MKLTSIKPRILAAPARMLAPVARPNVAERHTGYKGVKERERIRKRDGHLCVNCGQLGREVDHAIPLWVGIAAGGTNNDSNLRVLCVPCHEAKSAAETGQRLAGRYDRAAILRVMLRIEQERRLVARVE